MKRPVIGICTAFEQARWGVWDQQAALLPANYLRAIQGAGGLAVMLAPDEQLTEDPDQAIDLIDGLILAGGADIDPGSYGELAHPMTIDTVPVRDRFEIALVRAAIERDVPVLGICRGMQLLNVALGGTLVQHLPERVSHEEHRRAPGSLAEDAAHDVELAEGSLAAGAAGETHHSTRSHHHQGVDCLGSRLVVSGSSALDDVPEAIELPDRRFVLGVQWHPEADESSAVIGALVQAAARTAVASAAD
jgi:putative glutamine amidotransferase